MRKPKIFAKIIFGLILLPSVLLAQALHFQKIPAHLQLYPRDIQDSAVVEISGTVTETGYNQISLDVLKDDQLYKQFQQSLTYSGGSASFSFLPKINAGLHEYDFKIYLDGQLTTRRDSITCGDVFLINGQSNSHPNASSYSFRSEYCRSFGRHTNYNNYNPADTTWGLSTGQGWCDSCLFAVGTWGLRLQQTILENYEMPTCFINGGSGGSSISYNLPDSANHMDLTTTYGRLLYRATKAKVAHHVKAMLWHQGESDSGSPDAEAYFDRFTELYNAWHQDYAPLDKIYVFQIHQSNCGGTRQDYLREVQRSFQHHWTDVEVMATGGLDGHDGCHYNDDGYLQMASWVFRLMARDFYHEADSLNVGAPDVVNVYFSDTQNKQITVEFNEPVIWPADTLSASMKNYFYLDGTSGLINNGHTDNGGYSVILDLNNTSNASLLTYLPNYAYNHTPTRIYEGPWIRNTRGVGALSFYEYPIGGGPSAVEGESEPSFRLFQNYPNPFNPVTEIRWQLPARLASRNKSAQIKLTLYNILGQKVRTLVNRQQKSKSGHFTFKAGNLAGGIYLYRIQAGSFFAVRKMLLLR